MGLEIETKMYIRDLAALQQQLGAAGAICANARYFERNQLFTSPYQDFEAERTILRLRQDHHNKITLKKPTEKTIQGLRVRHEFETTVGDWETMDAILQGLGYQHGLYYEKYRTVYTLPDIEQAEIVVDELPFGNFVEIEGETEAIDTTIHRLHLTECHRIGTNYAGLLKAIVKAQNLDFEHATFENFAGIEVDVSIFDTL